MSWNASSIKTVTTQATKNAKVLRRSLTTAERRLWWHLKYRLPLEASHFRRQVPLGPYVTDFCCLPERLIIEVDGHQHGFDCNIDYDRRRDAFLRANGYRILRVTNSDVMHQIDGVLDTIRAALTIPLSSTHTLVEDEA
ncbi:endonuclease domain-containing protein [Methylobacterium sp. J-090]|uniref:endonuclease domain-containing protein n=1 Tax=Methylobacterium sp. J-090 TaxID=2836666 RepID=UPI001FBAF8A3|nr:DUF559 domain-containing protein [Methylobacterium sp. J-090]MCJ2081061.1 DUF559 domain-containing protein [Methylobacterium sp. J-090]